MDHQNQSCQEQKILDISPHIMGSYNRTKTDNHVDNSVDNSINYYTSTNIYHANAPISKDQLEDTKRQEIFNWLSPINFSNRHIDIFNQREAGTGQWFLEDAVFLKWLHGESRTLLCQGIPGAGKSTLASIAIEYLETIFKDEMPVAITYIYCNYKEQMYQTAENLMNSILWQIGMASSKAFDAIRALHAKQKKMSTKPLRVEYFQTLKDAILAFAKVFIIVDAVDEMAESERDKFLKQIKALNGVNGVQLLIMSRPMRYLVEYFGNSAQMELRAQDTDIAAYLNEQIPHRYQLAILIQKNIMFQKEIVIGITEKAQGMFLLARLHLEEVATANTRRELRERIRKLPNGIDDTYNSALERIKAQGDEKANQAQAVLVWITYSLRPLDITELQHALAVTLNKEEDTRVDEDSLIPPNLILAFCGGLVILDEKSRIIRLVHYTAQDYFSRRTPQLLNPMPEATIAAACITYLSIGPDIYTLFWSDQQQYQFLLYAAQNWGHHARKALAYKQLAVLEQQTTTFLGKLEEVLELWDVKKFWKEYIGWQGNDLDATPGLVASTYGLYNIMKAIIEEPCSGLGEWWEDAVYYAINEGYEDVLNLLEEKAVHMKIVVRGNRAMAKAVEGNRESTVRLLLEKGANPEAGPQWENKTPLYRAVEAGHEGIVRLLLEKGVDIEAKSSWGKTPLHNAVVAGHVGIVRLLLERGADIEARSSWGKTSLHNAIEAGHEGIVRLLLEKGADIEARSRSEETPLYKAVKTGRKGIVRLLLEKGADIEARSRAEETPLFKAVKTGHESIVRLLLEKGADTEARSELKDTPLYKAVEAAHEGIVRLLLKKGADTEARSRSEETPLYKAVRAGNQRIVGLLLEKGIYTKASKRSEMESLLFTALKAGHGDIVRLLLEKGMDIEMRARWEEEITLYRVAEAGHEGSVRLLLEHGSDTKARLELWKGIMLYTAVAAGYEGIVRLLLAKGVDAHVGEVPLNKAVQAGHEGIVRLLLENGADIRSGLGNEALLYTAAHAGHEGIVQLLLEEVVDIEVRSILGETALYNAIEAGHEGIVQLLLEKGVDIEARSSLEETPLHWAIGAGHKGIIRLLLEKGADIDARSGRREETALYKAVEAGDEGIVRLLLEKGADTEIIAWDTKTPLYKAVESGHEGIVRVLLEKGADIEARSGWRKETLLCKAVEVGYGGIVRLLLKNGADTEARSSSGETLLYKAVKSNYEGIVQQLLENGADIEARSGLREETALYKAVETGHEGIVRLLLENGAKIEAIVSGKTCLHAAAMHGHTSVVRVLLEYGASLQVYGGTLLSLAARHGRRRLVHVLLEKGVNVNTPAIGTVLDETAPGTHTPLCSAIYGGHVGIVELLLEQGAHTDIGDVSPSPDTIPAARDMIKDLLLTKARQKQR